MHIRPTLCISALFLVIVSSVSHPFISNNPIELQISPSIHPIASLKSEDCGVAARYDSSQVTVLSECDGKEGQLVLVEDTRPVLTMRLSKDELREGALLPEKVPLPGDDTRNYALLPDGPRDDNALLGDVTRDAVIIIFAFEMMSDKSKVSLPVRYQLTSSKEVEVKILCHQALGDADLRVSVHGDMPHLEINSPDERSYDLGPDLGQCTLSMNTEVAGRARRQVAPKLQFDQHPYEDFYPENMPKNTPIMLVSASYTDGTSRAISYSLILHKFGSSEFEIDPKSGTIVLLTKLDYEENRVIRIPVLAQSETFDKTVTEVVINVEDVNDETPQFVRDEYLMSVLDSTPIGAQIGSVLATDRDSALNGEVTYSIADVGDSDKFSVDEKSGEIRIRSSLHDKPVYSFVVEGCDRGTPPLKSNVTVSVFVQNTTIRGVVVPRFEQRSYSTSISELGRSGAHVLRVRVMPTSPLQFSIMQGSTPAQNSPRRFDIDPYTGEITRLGPVDYDSDTPVFYLVVKLRTTQLPPFEDYTQVIIKLEDVNDNVPIFTNSKYSASVLENVPPGVYITTVTATDNDSGRNSDLTYSFGSGDTRSFSIDEKLGHIYTRESLDRERQSVYNFFVFAKDSGEPVPQESGAKVEVEVVDVNDCKPVFRSAVMEVSIGEGAGIGDLVTTLTSLDQDVGQNAAVTYSFLSGDVMDFSLDPSTGIVLVNTDLDYETQQQYSIRVQATDGKFFDEAELVIKLVDVNDNSPVFEKNEYPISVPENVVVGTRLVQLSASDADIGSPQDIRYKITSISSGDSGDSGNSGNIGDSGIPFSVDEESGWLSVSGGLDRELEAEYGVLVTATDNGGLEDVAKVIVTVLDINDNIPTCQPPFTGSVPENAIPGTLVFIVNATDPDKGENSTLSYRLLEDRGMFAVDPETGHVTVTLPADREATPELHVIVEVTDGSLSKPLSAKCDYTIKVLDKNDNSPTFAEDNFSVSLSEVTTVGTPFFTAECSDEDEGRNGQLDFSITAGNSPPTFDIDSRTGELSVIRALDYDTISSYLLDISVTDRAEPYHASSTQVSITVEDANDSPPAFEKSLFTVYVSEDAESGEVVAEVPASDPDADQLITYSLNTTYDGLFSLSVGGSVVLEGVLDREETAHYYILVEACDNGSPPLSTSTTLHIILTDVNDNSPLLLAEEYHVTTSRDAAPGSPLLWLSITDADTPANGAPFTTTIISGNINSCFTVEDNVLKVAKPADMVAEFTLLLSVSDSGSPPLSTEITVTIATLDSISKPLLVESVHVNLPLFDDHVVSTIVWNFVPSSYDPTSVLVCGLSTPHPDFRMFPNGTLVSVQEPSIGTHRLTVHVSDGKHNEISYITVQVFSLSSAAAANPLTIQIGGVSRDSFNEELFVTVLAEIFRIGPGDVVLLSAEEKLARKRAARNILEVSIMAKSGDSEYMTVNEMKRLISRDVELLQDRTGYRVENVDVDPCLREPCPMSSTCVPITTYRLSDDGAGVTSSNMVTSSRTVDCRCEDGLSGSQCQDKVPCYSNPCGTGTCVVDEDEAEKCLCDENFTGRYCDIPVRHCLSSPCLNGGSCRDESVGYSCACLNGFRGPNCEIKIVPDDLCDDSPCGRHSTCTSGIDDVTCTCDEGWGGEHCTFVSEEADGCTRNPCQHGGECRSDEEGGSGFSCECSSGFSGDLCQDNIDDCASSPCLNGGSCTDGVDGYVCTCQEGYSGTNCQRTQQPCDASPCQNGGFCHNIDSDSYLCHCGAGYVGPVCETPLHPPRFCNPSPCSGHTQHCTAGLLNYTCTCSLTWRGHHCDIPDKTATQCDLNPCFNGGKCVPQPDGFIPFVCQCEDGFSGLQCEENVNECTSSTCLNGGTCVDRTNTFECVCRSGFSGRRCQVTEDPCLSLPCRNGGRCHAVEESYVCQCSASHTGRNCEIQLSHCPEHHCRNGGQCGVKRDGSVSCTCLDGYHGDYCDLMYERCSPNPCLHGGSCIESADAFRCACAPGYDGPLCQLAEIGVEEGGHYAVPVPQLKYATVSVKIRTRSSSGIILYIGRYGGGQDYLLLYLSGDKLGLRYSLGDTSSAGPATLLLDKKMSDRKWHVLTLSLDRKQVTLTVDECHDKTVLPHGYCHATTSASGAYYSLDTNTPLYLGGTDHFQPYLPETQLYQGCFKELYINKELIDFSVASSSSRSTKGCMVHDCKTVCSGRNVCTTTGGVVSCQCPWGYTGAGCATLAPSVTLPASLVLPIPRSSVSTSTLMVSLELKTRVPDCLVYVMGSATSEDYLAVSLVGGFPTVTLLTRDGSRTTLTLLDVRVDNGEWHTVLLNKVLNTVELEVDSLHKVSNHTSDWSTQFSLRAGQISLGADLESGGAHRSSSGMVGCVRDLRVGNTPIDLFSGSGDVVLGCGAAPACLHATCPSTHRCIDVWGDYECACPRGFSGPQCNCPAGYTGDDCQYEIDECAPAPCSVHGATSCTDMHNDYKCTCAPGYTGKNCEVNINECAGAPCKNGGSCLDLVNGFQCRCKPRYTGPTCDIDTTPCADRPCKNRGLCTEFGSGQFGCTCSIGWGGDLCELPKSCDFDPCVHGTCARGADSAEFVTCECEERWAGPTCSTPDCSNSCVHGVCGAGGVCECRSGYSGPTCAEEESQSMVEVTEPIQVWVIVVVAILGTLLLIVVTLLVACRKRCYDTTPDGNKYNTVPPTPAHPYCQQPQYYSATDKYQPMYQQRGYHGNMVHMSELSQSTATLDNEIKL